MRCEQYAFGDATIDVPDRRVLRAGRPVSLAPKAFDLLVELVRRAGHLVTKRELLDAIWPEAFVEEGIVSVHVSALRKALAGLDCIQTVSKSGYRFVLTVTTDVASRPRPESTSDVYEQVGRARADLMSAARGRLPAAVQGFEAAVDLDPTYAPAHAGLALALCAQAELRIVSPADGYGRARASAMRALALDDGAPDAWTALGCVMFMAEWDWIGAERALQRALELDTNHVRARLIYGRLLDALGRLDEGLAMKLRALETDPFSPSVHVAIALSCWNQRRYDEAIRWANKTLELDPSHGLAREFLAGAYWALGDFDRHMEENLRHAAAHGVTPEALEPLRRAYADHGRQGVLRLSLDQAANHPAGFPQVQLALLHGELGDVDAALPHLERAIADRDPCLVDLAVAPQWDALRADPRFERFLREMRLPTTHSAPLTATS
jgi:DNA-binding winged helix-turn-helix (wHTH) protein